MIIATEGRNLSGAQAVDDESGRGLDPLRRFVHVTLALYLLPVLALVLVLGGILVVITGVANALLGLAYLRPRPGTNTSRRLIKPPMTDRYGRVIRMTPQQGGGDATANDPLS